MKKQASLAQQVRDAQKVVGSWPKQKRESVQIEGSDIYLNRETTSPLPEGSSNPTRRVRVR